MIEKMDFADGKYTVLNDNGKLTALRYGEPWRDLSGDNLIYWMMVDARRLKEQKDMLLEALKAAEPYLRHADVAYNVYVQARAAIKAVEEGK